MLSKLMGLAMGIEPKRLGIGKELVSVMPTLSFAHSAESE
jgi:heterodisulfide reductase subunit B